MRKLGWMLLPLALGAQERPVLIRGGRVFDGTTIQTSDVILQGGRIRSVGANLKAPEQATVVDATGCTLLPGFLDAHAHVISEKDLAQDLTFGVTTALDMFTSPDTARSLKAPESSRADLRSAGWLATVAGGHGTEYPIKPPVIGSPAEAEAWVAARIAEGSDYVKVVLDDGSPYGFSTPTLDQPTLVAIVKAAHARKRLVVAHVGQQKEARRALEAGADGLAHLWSDEAPDPALVKAMKAKGMFVVPTLSVLKSLSGGQGTSLTGDVRLRPFLSPEARAALEGGFNLSAKATSRYMHGAESAKALRDAGVPLLAGTDAPNPGTTHGATLHGELSLLVGAGLTPMEALTAATAAPARVFGLPDRGRIAAGLRADLVLVKGDPTTHIEATRDIVSVWKEGVVLDRDARRVKEAPVAPLLQSRIWSFQHSTSGWAVTTDRIIGGKSEGTLTQAEGALQVHGELKAGGAFPWVGAMVKLGGNASGPVSLGEAKVLRVKVRGQGTLQALLYHQAGGFMPTFTALPVSAEWNEVRLPLSAFRGFDPLKATALALCAMGQPGPVSFEIAEVAFE